MSFRIDRVYTRSGDKGDTGLVGGKRVPKDSTRITAYGTVDELNAVVGMTAAAGARLKKKKLRKAMARELKKIQQQLFNLGSELACPPGKLLAGMPVVTAESVAGLEKSMDRLSRKLKPLTTFILPGGGEATAWGHVARTVCRRAERVVVTLRRKEPSVRPETVQYLNRLSDWFFVFSRYVAHECGESENLWDKKIL